MAGRSVTLRALSILDAFDVTHRRLNLTEIARRSELPLATAHRHVRELVDWQALERREDGTYQIGSRLRHLGLLSPMHAELRELALPHLQDLYAATGATVHLAVREGAEALYVERLGGVRSVPVVSRPGGTLPLHATAVGKVRRRSPWVWRGRRRHGRGGPRHAQHPAEHLDRPARAARGGGRDRDAAAGPGGRRAGRLGWQLIRPRTAEACRHSGGLPSAGSRALCRTQTPDEGGSTHNERTAMGPRRGAPAGLVALGAAALVVLAGSSVAAAGSNGAIRSCASLASTHMAHTTIVSATAVPATASVPAHCAVQLVVTNPPAEDQVRVGVWLPTQNWNRRFQGVGGGGFSGGSPDTAPAAALRGGYAAAATDAGHAGGSGSFALNPDGTLNWQLIADFGYLGIHEMTVAAQTLVRKFYGTSSFHSYFNGCSTGGRQGLMEAQRYPTDYDGIAAGAPAINWTKFHPAQLWGQLQMLLAGNVIPPCELAAATQAATAACDPRDGVSDGIVGDWQGCRFDARTLVGTATPCGTITATDADLINKMWAGPRDADGGLLWYGLERDAPLQALNNSSGGIGQPFFVGLEWFRYFLLQNPGWDWRTMTYEQYLLLFQQSVLQYQAVIATDDPDLSRFRDAGGKVVFWHGTADPLIFFRGSVDYYQRLADAMGGAWRTKKFARFFVAPGVGHCGGGQGAAPADPLDAVVRWVEHGKAPDTLAGQRTDAGGNVVLTRPVCQYPLVARYSGRGATTDAKNFTCAGG